MQKLILPALIALTLLATMGADTETGLSQIVTDVNSPIPTPRSKTSKRIPLAGPETAGRVVKLDNGVAVDLPDDFMLDGVIGGITCDINQKRMAGVPFCPKTPAYPIVSMAHTELRIYVDYDGVIWEDVDLVDERRGGYEVAFSWLYDQLPDSARVSKDRRLVNGYGFFMWLYDSIAALFWG